MTTRRRTRSIWGTNANGISTHVTIVIPAYNEARTVATVVRSVREHVPYVVVVDDGSSDGTGDLAAGAGAVVVRHVVNRGLGAALGTGIAAALHSFPPPLLEGEREGVSAPDILITMDADGQHDPADIAALIAPIESGDADVVVGTRFSNFAPPPAPPLEEGEGQTFLLPHLKEGVSQVFSPPHLEGGRGGVLAECRMTSARYALADAQGGAPRSRVLANRIANIVTRVLFGVRCSDTQSGFRAFSASAAAALDLRTNRMEVSSEILAEAARLNLRIAEVPIRTIYTAYSLSKGQSLSVGVRTAWGLLVRRWM